MSVYKHMSGIDCIAETTANSRTDMHYTALVGQCRHAGHVVLSLFRLGAVGAVK